MSVLRNARAVFYIQLWSKYVNKSKKIIILIVIYTFIKRQFALPEQLALGHFKLPLLNFVMFLMWIKLVQNNKWFCGHVACTNRDTPQWDLDWNKTPSIGENAFQISLAKYQPFCLDLNVLIHSEILPVEFTAPIPKEFRCWMFLPDQKCWALNYRLSPE